jgi:hypothetical protein
MMIAIAEVLGFIVLLPACLLHLWTEPNYISIKPLAGRVLVDEWSLPLLNKWYGNSEDGVSGQQAIVYDDAGHLVPYASTFPSWVPKWAIAYAWSAWRNGANNIKRPSRTDGLNTPVK